MTSALGQIKEYRAKIREFIARRDFKTLSNGGVLFGSDLADYKPQAGDHMIFCDRIRSQVADSRGWSWEGGYKAGRVVAIIPSGKTTGQASLLAALQGFYTYEEDSVGDILEYAVLMAAIDSGKLSHDQEVQSKATASFILDLKSGGLDDILQGINFSESDKSKIVKLFVDSREIQDYQASRDYFTQGVLRAVAFKIENHCKVKLREVSELRGQELECYVNTAMDNSAYDAKNTAAFLEHLSDDIALNLAIERCFDDLCAGEHGKEEEQGIIGQLLSAIKELISDIRVFFGGPSSKELDLMQDPKVDSVLEVCRAKISPSSTRPANSRE